MTSDAAEDSTRAEAQRELSTIQRAWRTEVSPPDRWGSGWYERDQRWRAWERRFARQVLAEAQRRRKELKLTARELSERLTNAGWPVTINSVNGIFGKKGRESISVTQLIALADALEDSPARLLFGSEPEEVEIRPGVFLPPGRAALWFLKGAAHERAEAEPESLEAATGRFVTAALNEHGLAGAAEYIHGIAAAIEKLATDLKVNGTLSARMPEISIDRPDVEWIGVTHPPEDSADGSPADSAE